MLKRLILGAVVLTMSFSIVSASSFDSFTSQNFIIRPSGVALAENNEEIIFTDVKNNAIFISDMYGNIERITGENKISTVGKSDGDVSNATFNTPWGISKFLDGYAITDSLNHRIRYYDVEKDVIQTISGSDEGFKDGSANEALFNRPTGITEYKDGSILVSDTDNNVIRIIDEDGVVDTFAGSTEGNSIGDLDDTKFSEPTGICYADGIIYIADTGNNRIVAIEDEKSYVVAGTTGVEGFKNGDVLDSLLSFPLGVYFYDDVLYISDSSNGAIRAVSDGSIETVLDTGELENGLTPVDPRGLLVIDDKLIVADTFSGYLSILDVNEYINPYVDVFENDWYYDYVMKMGKLSILNGVSEDEFSPKSYVTRAMFITTLSRIEENINPSTVISGEMSFSDVISGSYYEKAVSWGYQNGITEGSNGLFLPNNTLTRAECATFLYRYANLIGFDMTLGDLSAFEDANLAPEYAKDAISWAVNQGILTGKDENTIAPNDSITRAELSAMLARFFDKI